MDRDDLLRRLRLKGYLAPAAGGAEPEAIARLVRDGLAEQTRLGLNLTVPGRAAADALWADERSRLPEDAMAALYARFNEVNPVFKALVAQWQQGGDRQALVGELRAIHATLADLLSRLVELLPRFSRYESAFALALAEIERGNHRFLAAPLIESYHTLWFELHEELIRLSGRTRAGEAASGHAA